MIFTTLILTSFLSLDDPTAAHAQLKARQNVTESEHFSNPSNYSLGKGNAIQGLFYGKTSVSSDGDLSQLELTVAESSIKFDQGHVYLRLRDLEWNAEDGLMHGVGTLYGRSHRHCPVRELPVTTRIKLRETHPFRGAFELIELTYEEYKENLDCEPSSEPIQETVVLPRVYKHIELIQAMKALVQEGEAVIPQFIEQMRTIVRLGYELNGLMKDSGRMDQQTYDAQMKIAKDLEKTIDTDFVNIVSALRDLFHALIHGGEGKYGGLDYNLSQRVALDDADPETLALIRKIFEENEVLPSAVSAGNPDSIKKLQQAIEFLKKEKNGSK
jgi:hypothetical protein